MEEVTLRSTITCPECGTRTDTEMPTDRCQFFWECPSCEHVLRPQEGDCCVFCTYGTVVCPAEQRANR